MGGVGGTMGVPVAVGIVLKNLEAERDWPLLFDWWSGVPEVWGGVVTPGADGGGLGQGENLRGDV